MCQNFLGPQLQMHVYLFCLTCYLFRLGFLQPVIDALNNFVKLLVDFLYWHSIVLSVAVVYS